MSIQINKENSELIESIINKIDETDETISVFEKNDKYLDIEKKIIDCDELMEKNKRNAYMIFFIDYTRQKLKKWSKKVKKILDKRDLTQCYKEMKIEKLESVIKKWDEFFEKDPLMQQYKLKNKALKVNDEIINTENKIDKELRELSLKKREYEMTRNDSNEDMDKHKATIIQKFINDIEKADREIELYNKHIKILETKNVRYNKMVGVAGILEIDKKTDFNNRISYNVQMIKGLQESIDDKEMEKDKYYHEKEDYKKKSSLQNLEKIEKEISALKNKIKEDEIEWDDNSTKIYKYIFDAEHMELEK